MIIESLNYGVGQGEEGVCLSLSLGPYRILLDCGLADISSLKADWLGDGPIDFVFCSHAHGDHARGLLDLHRAFPQLPVYASEVTTHLLPLNWPEADPIPDFCRALPWRSPIEFCDGLTAELFPAGHLPGAAACLITYGNPSGDQASVLYTGDFFLSNTRFADGLPLADVRGLQPDVLIMEASLGTARHPHRRQQENQLADRIHQALIQGYNIVLPLPALGIAQEILILLRSHHRFTGQEIDIWVGPAIAQACNAYLAVLPHLPTAIQNFAQHQSPFWDQRVRPRVQPLPQPDQFPGSAGIPQIILADQDQVLDPYLSKGDRPWLILYPRLLYGHDTQPEDFIPKDHGQFKFPIEAESFLLSLHSDGPATTQLIHNIRPQHVILLHGDPNYLTDLASLNELSNRYHLHTPTPSSRLEMPLGQLSITAPTTLVNTAYEGDVLEWGDRAVVSLPLEIIGDARWRRLADTGFILASWQGEQLVLRGMTAKEVLSTSAEAIAAEKDCCYSCQFYRGQRCWNQLSPLYNFKVAPEGYCPSFQRIEATPAPPTD